MNMKTSYKSIKAFHPGVTLEEKLQELGMSVEEFSAKSGVSPLQVHLILAGFMSVTPEIAYAFEQVTQIPAHFWLNAQHAYDEYQLQHIAQDFRDHLAQMESYVVKYTVHNEEVDYPVAEVA